MRLRFSVVVTGLGDLLDKCAAMPRVAMAAARPGVARETAEIAAVARSLAPSRTNELAESIVDLPLEIDGMIVEGKVATDVPYALQNEFGTTEMEPTPFLRPAANIGATERLRRVGKSVAAAIKRLGD